MPQFRKRFVVISAARWLRRDDMRFLAAIGLLVLAACGSASQEVDDADMRIAYGPGSSQFGDLQVPAGSGPHPVVVLVHGGFWRDAYDLTLMDPLSDDLVARGFATWNIEYRPRRRGRGWLAWHGRRCGGRRRSPRRTCRTAQPRSRSRICRWPLSRRSPRALGRGPGIGGREAAARSCPGSSRRSGPCRRERRRWQRRCELARRRFRATAVCVTDRAAADGRTHRVGSRNQRRHRSARPKRPLRDRRPVCGRRRRASAARWHRSLRRHRPVSPLVGRGGRTLAGVTTVHHSASGLMTEGGEPAFTSCARLGRARRLACRCSRRVFHSGFDHQDHAAGRFDN